VNLLLVEPPFPRPPKSHNHSCFLPIGLLKLASLHRRRGDSVRLIQGCARPRNFTPDRVLITSLFTYWADSVRRCVSFYKALFPHANTLVGGIYASLMPEHCLRFTGCDQVFVGLHPEAEGCPPAYDLVRPPHQVIHASRGCPRSCGFCGASLIHPRFSAKSSIAHELVLNRVLFYDDNFLSNPHVEGILEELAGARLRGKPVTCECQPGFDGRVLLDKPQLARMLKKARFVRPRIAWDGPFDDRRAIAEQLRILKLAGFRARDMSVFILYNWDIPFPEVERKRKACAKWRLQIADCRYRPLSQTQDHYIPGAPERVRQTPADYYIHEPAWSDGQIRQFRKNVREQNISLRCGSPYDRSKELAGRAARRQAD
jgi:hypothetical protein